MKRRKDKDIVRAIKSICGRGILLTFCLIVCSLAVSGSEKTAPHYTVVISLDGCRWDYPQWYDTPFFDEMAAQGVSASMIPSFPSKTFPNHYTMATGLYPDHHGIVANRFYDRRNNCVFDLGDPLTKFNARYYGGEPLWLTAQRQGIHTAEVYWPGSDVAVGGKYPDSYYDYDTKPQLSLEQRADRIIELLLLPEEKRPRLIMAYFEQPDGIAHDFGPQSKETRHMVERMDSLIHTVWHRIEQLPIAGDINFIVTSDHGMASISNQRRVAVKKYIKPQWVKRIDGDLPGQIYVNDGFADSVVNALKNVPHLHAWKRAEIPAYLHYGSSEMVGDVVALPELGWLFRDKAFRDQGGSHGFDPSYSDMHALFRAVGPDFKKAYFKMAHFRNVDLYPLVCRLLGIQPAQNDGDLKEVEDLLK